MIVDLDLRVWLRNDELGDELAAAALVESMIIASQQLETEATERRVRRCRSRA